MDADQAVAEAANVATNAFYSIGQLYVSEEDGGIADMVEEKFGFHGKVAEPMMRLVQRGVGTTRLLEGLKQLRDDSVLAAEIEPVCGASDWFSEDIADLTAAEASFMFFSKVYAAFPEIGGDGLDHFTDPAFEISLSHLRSQANFRVKEDLASRMP